MVMPLACLTGRALHGGNVMVDGWRSGEPDRIPTYLIDYGKVME